MTGKIRVAVVFGGRSDRTRRVLRERGPGALGHRPGPLRRAAHRHRHRRAVGAHLGRPGAAGAVGRVIAVGGVGGGARVRRSRRGPAARWRCAPRVRCRATSARWTWCCRCCTGRSARTARIQGLLEMTGTRYAGAGVFASAAGMDKEYMKLIIAARGPAGRPLRGGRDRDWSGGTGGVGGQAASASASGSWTRSRSWAGRCSSSRPAAGRASGSRGLRTRPIWSRRWRRRAGTIPRCWSKPRWRGWRSSARCWRASTAGRPRRACPGRWWWTRSRRSTTSRPSTWPPGRRCGSRRRSRRRPPPRSGGWPARRSRPSPARAWPGSTSSTPRPGRCCSTRSTRCRG